MIYIALPVLNESQYIPDLLECLKSQQFIDFEIFICVNNYEHWWQDEELKNQCRDNQRTIEYLQGVTDFKLTIIDKSSPSRGWSTKKGGVGHARKHLMDTINEVAQKDDIIVSIDADTYYPPDYLKKINDFFNENSCIGLSIPYYHKLGSETDKLILRYEIYMRYYLLNMYRIENPYAFTAVGSAMAFPVWAYRKVGGLTPVKSGEDFYFIQKLTKTEKVCNWVDTCAYPSARFSNRVDFGTGPALIKGNKGDWSSYPIYDYTLFDKVQQTFSLFGELYLADIETTMDEFLKFQFKVEDVWGPLRKNYKDIDNFIKACVNKVDALRILQFLKSEYTLNPSSDSEVLKNYLMKFHTSEMDKSMTDTLYNFDFETISLKDLSYIRDFLFNLEQNFRILHSF